MQEIGINVDTHTSTEQYSLPQVSKFEMSTTELDSHSLNEFYQTRLSTTYNYGAKKNSNLGMESTEDTRKRILLFAQWCFQQEEVEDDDKDKDTNNDDREQSVSVSASASPTGAESSHRDSSKLRIINKAKHMAFKKRKSKGSSKSPQNSPNLNSAVNSNNSGVSNTNFTIQNEGAITPVDLNFDTGNSNNHQNNSNKNAVTDKTLFRSDSHYPDYNNPYPNNGSIMDNITHTNMNGHIEHTPEAYTSNNEDDSHNNNNNESANGNFDNNHVTRIDLSKTDEKSKKLGFLTSSSNKIKNKTKNRNKNKGRTSNNTNNTNNNNSGNSKKRNSNEMRNVIPPVVIAVGHSKWFKQFFQTFLPSKMDYIGKESKITNCGVIAFRFFYDPNKNKFGIAPKTLTTIYKGFGES